MRSGKCEMLLIKPELRPGKCTMLASKSAMRLANKKVQAIK
jgi:hypothetical protein